MFDLTLSKEQLLVPLMTVAGTVDKKPAIAILSHILMTLADHQLWLTGMDLEIEIMASVPCDSTHPAGQVTVPAKKLLDIIRSLDDTAVPTLAFNADTVTISAGRSQFKLATLPAERFPTREDEVNEVEFTVSRLALMDLLQATHFAVAQQDVRLFLGGLLLELNGQTITAVGTDGHRLAVCKLASQSKYTGHRFLVPKKGVQEILKLLSNIEDDEVVVAGGKRYLKVVANQYRLRCSLIDTRFPCYTTAIPNAQDKSVVLQRDTLKKALMRIAILANEKSRAVLLHLQANTLTLIAHNQEQEEAVETLEAETTGEDIKIALNVTYLLDVLNYLNDGLVRLSLSNTDASILVESLEKKQYQYIIMPMRL